MKPLCLLTHLCMVALLAAVPHVADAIPAWPGTLTRMQPDGTLLTYRLVGDEHWHTLTTDDGYEIAADANGTLRYVERGSVVQLTAVAHNSAQRSVAEQAALARLPRASRPADGLAGLSRSPLRSARKLSADGFPTTGSVRGMVLLVEFSDNSFQPAYTREVYQQLMNTEGYSEYGATGSSRDYFVAQSMGVFTPTFDVVGPVKLSRPMAYYGDDDQGGYDAHVGEMVEEACRLAHEQGSDFSQYDYNNDGKVDFVFIIYAGYGQQYGAPSATIWPHTANLPDWGIDLSLDGKQMGRYACGSELKYNSGTQLEGIGTFCHEFGHVLGLPDFYDTRHANSTRIGVWSVMDQGCYNNESRTPCAYSAFERYSLGWLTMTELTEPQNSVQLQELTQHNVAYRVSTSRPDEYFVLENRQQRGWDAYLPARGMMVTHVDYDKEQWNQNTVNNGADMRYDLVEADGLMSKSSYATDLFPSHGVDKLTDTSSPSMRMRNGSPTGKPIISIRDVDGIISFRFMQLPLSRPEAPVISSVEARSLVAAWTAVEGAQGYRLQAREVLSAEENPIVADEDFNQMQAGTYGVPDAAEMGSVLDSYLLLEGWTGENLRQAGGRLYMGEGATLKSPLVDLSTGPDGAFLVALHAMAAPEQQATFMVKALRNNGRELSTSDLLTADENDRDIVVKLSEGIGRTRIELTCTSGELYIDRLRIVCEPFDEDNVWAEAAHTAVADGLSGTSAKLTGLLPQKTYAVTLTALADDEELSSQPSAEVLVNTKSEADGIAATAAAASGPAVYYNMQGQLLHRPHKGFTIQKSARGTVKKVLLQ